MRQKVNKIWVITRQAATAVLLFVFFAGISYGGVAEDLTGGKLLQDVIADSLAAETTVNDLVSDLAAAGVAGKDIICGLIEKGAEKYAVIAAALDNGMNSNDVSQWAFDCGATIADVQTGFSKSGENLPPAMVFREYLYNPASPSK